MQEDPFAPAKTQEDPFAPASVDPFAPVAAPAPAFQNQAGMDAVNAAAIAPGRQFARPDFSVKSLLGLPDSAELGRFIRHTQIPEGQYVEEMTPEGKAELERQRGLLEEHPIAMRVDQTAGNLLNAAGIGEANIRDLSMQIGEGEYGQAVKTGLRSLAGVIPFVPQREASEEAVRQTQARERLRQELRQQNLGDRLLQDAGSMTGFLTQFAGAKAPLAAASKLLAPRIASKTVQVALGAQKGTGKLGGLVEGIVPSAGAFGLIRAEEPLMRGELGTAGIEFARGVGQDAALRIAGAFGAGAASHALQKRLSERAMQLARPAAGGFAQGMLQVAKNPEQDVLGQIISEGLVFGAAGAIPSTRRALPGVDAISRELQVKTTPDVVPTGEQVAAASGPATTTLPLQGDPSYSAVLMGKRPAHLLPTLGGPSLPTEAENALRNNPLPEWVAKEEGVRTRETPLGTVTWMDRSRMMPTPNGGQFRAIPEGTLEHDLKKDPAMRSIAIFKKDANGQLTGEVDVEASIDNAVKTDQMGVLLKYGAGNERKPPIDSNWTLVVGRDRYGREIASIVASNPHTAAEALKKHHGASRVEYVPKEKAGEVILTRKPFVPKTEPPGVQTGQSPRIEVETQKRLTTRPPGDTVTDPMELSTRARRMAEAGATEPTFSPLSGESPELVTAMRRELAARGAADQFAGIKAAELERLTNNPRLLNMFMRDLIDAQAEGGVAQGRHVPEALFQSPQERAEVEANREAIDRLYGSWRDAVGQLAPLAAEGGVSSTRPIREGSAYQHLTPVDLGITEVPGGIQVESSQLKALRDAEKKTGLSWMRGDPEVIAALKDGFVPEGTRAYRELQSYNRLRTPQAQEAAASKFTGFTSPVYSMLPQDVLSSMARDAFQASARSELLASMHGEAARIPHRTETTTDPITLKQTTKDLGPEKFVRYGNKVVPTKAVDIGELPSWMKDVVGEEAFNKIRSQNKNETVVVASPVAHGFEMLRRIDPQARRNWFSRFNSNWSGIDAAVTLADGPKTWARFLARLASMPGVGGDSKLGRMVEAIGGPARFIAAAVRAGDVTDSSYAHDFTTLLRDGIIDIRSTGEADRPGQYGEVAQRYFPGADMAQQMGYGADGVANRIKVAMYRLLRAQGINHAEAVDELIRTTGSTVNALQPAIVRAASAIGADAYPNAHYQAIQSGLRAIGVGPEGTTDKRILTGTITNFVLGSLLATWAATDEDEKRSSVSPGRFAGIPLDFRAGYLSHDGEQIPWWKATDPNAERLLRVSGVESLVENIIAGNMTWENAWKLPAKAALTQQLNRLAPGSALGLNVVEQLGVQPRFSRHGVQMPPKTWGQVALDSVPGAGSIGDAERLLQQDSTIPQQIGYGVSSMFFGQPNIPAKTDLQVGQTLLGTRAREQGDDALRIALDIRRRLIRPEFYVEEATEAVGAPSINEATPEQLKQIKNIIDMLGAVQVNKERRAIEFREGR